jgi:N,N'-diacetylchitobiose phosphorylase
MSGEDARADQTLGAERRIERDGYVIRLSPLGTGPSGLDGMAVTGGWEYPERHGGMLVYVRDLDLGRYWTACLHPGGPRPARFGAWPDAPVPRFIRQDGGVETALEVAVMEGPAEVRRLTLTNAGDTRRRLEVTSYVPIALDSAAAYSSHPAFSKLFVQTGYVPELQALLARRRPRSPDDPPVSAMHLLVPDTPDGEPEIETDRARFLGRGRGPGRPRAMDPDATALSGTVGNVLDPVLALRRTAVLAPGESAGFTLVLGAGSTPEEARRVVAGFVEPEATRAALEAQRPGDPGADRGALLLAAMDDSAGRGRVTSVAGRPVTATAASAGEELAFFNGLGGFSQGGDEYVIRLGRGPDGLRRPPLPWINVVANEGIGFLASESGAGYTWVGNSRLNRLTPWYNDPVTDPHGEAFYLRDEESGEFWSPMPGPAPGAGPYETRHGFGYTRYRHESGGLEQDVWHLAAPDDPVKLVWLRVTNRSGRRRRLTAWAYFEWVLGGGAESRPHVDAAPDPGRSMVLARNPRTQDFEEAVAFAAAVGGRDGGATALRAAFLGPAGSVRAPTAVVTGARPGAGPASGDESCAGLWSALELEPGETGSCAFLLGQVGSPGAARSLVDRFAAPGAVEAARDEVRSRWCELLGRVRVETPCRALDLMANGWLAYQDLSCRIHGRSALYQSGGAYGYRDQLQDATGLIHLAPELARRQIVLHAAHQFPEGDVMHWWHPPASRGIRTRFSDDLLWLPYVAGSYLDVTGDEGVLDEKAPFVTGPPLAPGEDEVYLVPGRSEDEVSVYEHACRAIDRSLTCGDHGLPLIGTGDWNDGMNRVGRDGEGESVWLGFFLATILDRWIPICEARGDADRAIRYRAYREELVAALNGDAGWDGRWYRRAYYDSGDPLGSVTSDECRIDAIAQAWSILSRVAPSDRAGRALDSLEEYLVDEANGLIRLLTPPFDATPHDPGYIKGYIPGVRENGGQYTHGVLWAIRAMAEVGRADRAAALLEMLLPVSHASTPAGVERYRVEPYVVAADVYGTVPHVGRGGWTWYTGSAGWMYRIALESVLGLEIEGGRRLRLRPGLPSTWPGFRITYRVPGAGARYEIDVRRGDGGPTRATLDGEAAPVIDGATIIELEEAGVHSVRVTLGADAGRSYDPRTGQ